MSRALPYRLSVDGAVALVTLSNPQSRNALSSETLEALRWLVADLDARRDVRAVVLDHEGPAFCAGHDLKEITAARAAPDRGRAFFETLMASCAALMTGVRRMRQPVIAAVEGVATAAGCQLASCDLAIAGEQARFATPGVHIGLFCSTPMVALSRDVAPKQAMEMLLLGEPIGARRAETFGLVNRVAPAGERTATALDWARRIAEKSGATVAVGKRAFYEQAEMTLADAYAHASRVMVDNMLARDAQEGIGAFVAKRAPVWEHE
ncbi:MAG: enoyl-CoA hydratase [Rhodoblastus sp.]|nr:MAG: enoyl-CoA hydratase [Rhodoblastus sp.]